MSSALFPCDCCATGARATAPYLTLQSRLLWTLLVSAPQASQAVAVVLAVAAAHPPTQPLPASPTLRLVAVLVLVVDAVAVQALVVRAA